MTTEEARHILVAMSKVNHGLNPIQVLEALALNVGLEKVGSIGLRTEYDPKIHLDTEGGLLPGDMVNVINHGWKHGQDVLWRAEVDPVTNYES